MATFLSSMITLFAVIGILLALLSAAVLEFYHAKVPGGADAMGLFIPVFLAGSAGVSGLIASVLTGPRGGLDGLGWSKPAATAVLFVTGIFVGVSIIGAVIAWAEKHTLSHPGLLTLSGLLLPLGYNVVLIVFAWSSSHELQRMSIGKVAVSVASLAVLSGVISAGLMFQAYVRETARNQAYHLESEMKERAERERRDAMTPEARLLEDLSQFSPTTPLWTLTAGLPGEPSTSLRKIWIDRALQLTDLEQELKDTLSGQYGVYRHGCCFMIVEAPSSAVKSDTWGDYIASDAKLTAADVLKYQDLKEHDNDPLAAHVRMILLAAQRVHRTTALNEAIQELRNALASLESTDEIDRMTIDYDRWLSEP